MLNWIETQFWKVAIWILKREYGEFCSGDSPFGSCASCDAKNTVEFLKMNINLINYK